MNVAGSRAAARFSSSSARRIRDAGSRRRRGSESRSKRRSTVGVKRRDASRPWKGAGRGLGNGPPHLRLCSPASCGSACRGICGTSSSSGRCGPRGSRFWPRSRRGFRSPFPERLPDTGSRSRCSHTAPSPSPAGTRGGIRSSRLRGIPTTPPARRTRSVSTLSTRSSSAREERPSRLSLPIRSASFCLFCSSSSP